MPHAILPGFENDWGMEEWCIRCDDYVYDDECPSNQLMLDLDLTGELWR